MEKKETTFFQDYQNLINSFEALKKSEDNPFFKSKYVPLKVILPIVKENCTKYNFVFMQYPQIVEGKNTLQTRILHESGKDVTGSIEIVAKDFTDPQKVGAGLTYMRRYTLTCMFGLEEDDDDGNTAAGKDTAKSKIQNSLVIPGKCDQCGATAIQNPKTGNWYCPNYKTHGAFKIVSDSKLPKDAQDFLDSLPEQEIPIIK